VKQIYLFVGSEGHLREDLTLRLLFSTITRRQVICWLVFQQFSK